ncbi:endoplasmic reticulum metallopeptidase 1-like [Anastrepha ludens]|uniref:endoplasmic reticulum metallopeptidase 1-like n=1 Tax=Anastrepha ludens TaxID=28586 RepID=UPI0023B18433|nr:endoplasmic reticulum metallopeptidase 1-like [Anastrepha ludens]
MAKMGLEQPKKLGWYYAPFFTAFWILLGLAIVLTQLNHLPTPLTHRDETAHPDSFIAERAEEILINLTSLGPRVVGSNANEVKTIELLLNEIGKVQNQMSDYFDIEVDTQVVSGQSSRFHLYQGVQNVLVKLSAKNNTSPNYLLINAHFDSVPGSPGAADDGSMVSTVLEVLRVIAKSNGPLEHPIVFLFNGAEEEGLDGAHGFVTQHKWAKNCKVVINLDAAGSGGRELLFRSSASNSWLINYYRKVPHPFATTLAEDIYQTNFISSGTDFRIFRDYAGMLGLDLAYIHNGYVYHTEYDSMKVLPIGSLQNTGDNVLSLAKSVGNAPEMWNLTAADNKTDHLIFYDFLGWFMLSYTLSTSIIINYVVCSATLIAITLSLFMMSKATNLGWLAITSQYALALLLQIFSIAVGATASIFIAYFLDSIGYSMSWFSSDWLIFGLYFCPIFYFLGIFPALFLECTKRHPLCLSFRIQLFLHSQCLILIALTIALTILNINSAFMCMLAVFFYAVALIINLITKLHSKGYWFAIAVIVSQIVPFMFFSYVAQFVYYLFIPVLGRSGTTLNPDILISIVATIFSVLIGGFLMPLYFLFRKARSIIFCFLGITLLFVILAITPIGSPYTAKLAPQRYSVQHASQIFHNSDGSIRFNESAIYVYPIDRHTNTAKDVINRFKTVHNISDVCNDEISCLLRRPSIFYTASAFWLPVDEAPIIPSEKPLLTLTDEIILNTPNTKRYNYTLTGPDHLTIFIGPKAPARVVNWSFDKTLLPNSGYFMSFVYGKDNKALEFFIDLELPANNSNSPNLEIGIAGNWVHQSVQRAEIYEEFLQSFPDYTIIVNWVATYDSWLF